MKKVFTKKLAVLLAASLLTTGAFVSCSDGSGNGGDSADTPSKTGIAADSLPKPVGISPVEDGLYVVTNGGTSKATPQSARAASIANDLDGMYTGDIEHRELGWYFDTKELTITVWADGHLEAAWGGMQLKYSYNDNEKSFFVAMYKIMIPSDMNAYLNAVVITEKPDEDIKGEYDWDYNHDAYKGSWKLADINEYIEAYTKLIFSDTFSQHAPNTAAQLRAYGKQALEEGTREGWNEIEVWKYEKGDNGVVKMTVPDIISTSTDANGVVTSSTTYATIILTPSK